MAEATTLIDQGLVQQLSGRYAAGAASLRQALALSRDLGNLLGQAEAHNNFGQLAIRAANTPQARTHHAQALAIARDISAPLEEARAPGRTRPDPPPRRQPRQRPGVAAPGTHDLPAHRRPAARRVQQALQNHRLTSTPELQPQTPSSKGHVSRVWRTPIDPLDG